MMEKDDGDAGYRLNNGDFFLVRKSDNKNKREKIKGWIVEFLGEGFSSDQVGRQPDVIVVVAVETATLSLSL